MLKVRGCALVTGGAGAQVADGEPAGGGRAQCATEVGRGGTVDVQREEGVADGFLPGLNSVQGVAALRGGMRGTEIRHACLLQMRGALCRVLALAPFTHYIQG